MVKFKQFFPMFGKILSFCSILTGTNIFHSRVGFTKADQKQEQDSIPPIKVGTPTIYIYSK